METIEISPADPQWASQYESEAAKLKAALCSLTPIVEHIGSTSVPHLPAKPVIDIMVGAQELRPKEIIPNIEALRYEHWKEDTFQHERLMFTKWSADKTKRLVNVHVTTIGSAFWTDQLTFRDKLRQNPDLVTQYVELKQSLAEKFKTDPEGYTQAKTNFIRDVINS